MIQRIVDFALRQRLAVLAATLLLVATGIHAYFSVPIEAYPDVGDTQVQVITQWQVWHRPRCMIRRARCGAGVARMAGEA